MRCKVDGCEKDARYKSQCVCQKHYFRFMRTGAYDLAEKKGPMKTREWNGYIRVHEPDHPLADMNGYVAEHRKVVYDRIGESLSECELCKKPVDWTTVHIDHKDDNRKNNAPDNLRPLCNGCNTRRGYPEQHTVAGRLAITYQGETKTPQEWARDPRVSIPGHTIRHRFKAGMTAEQALFSERKTHKNKTK